MSTNGRHSPRSTKPSFIVAFVAMTSLGLGACAAPSSGEDVDDDAPVDASEDAVVAGAPARVSANEVSSAITKVVSKRGTARFAGFYDDGVRVEACWANPAGSKLTELQKAVYCAMPLELRLCNTPVLLTTPKTDVAGRYAGYERCKTRLEQLLGRRGEVAYDASIDRVYRDIYLEGGTLSAADTARIVKAARPASSGRAFPSLLASIVTSLKTEGRDLAMQWLDGLAADFKKSTGLEPR
ncbi:MAG: hypothetical protein JST00_34285 [Deltaproteobacteria bacterium]|nr:hypothetical protein [Deltaproteobacteria bacterium]